MIRSSSTPNLASFSRKTKEGATCNMKKPLKTSFAPQNCPSLLHRPGDRRQAMHMRRTRSEDGLNTRSLIEEAPQDSPVRFRATHACRNKSPAVPKPRTIPAFSQCRKVGKGEEEEYDDDENVCNNDKEFSFPELGFPGSETSARGSDIQVFGFFGVILNGAVDRQSSWENPSAMYMATGLGIGGAAANIQVNKIEDERMEQHLEKLVKENPCNSLILKNYAQYLYKTKQDYKKAEEYYSMAILAEPSNGEVLSEYARLRWESSRDEHVASIYYEKAIQLSPENSYVLGAYASFLWETDSGEQQQDNPKLRLVLDYRILDTSL